MTAIAEFTLPPPEFPLGCVFEHRPAVTLELDRVVPSGDTVMPYFWVRDPDRGLEAIRVLFEARPELRSIALMEDLGERGLFRAEWHPDYLGIMTAIPETGLTVVSARGSKKGWVFELRAASGGQFSAFRDYCERHDIDVTLARLSHLSEAGDAGYGLTHEQREALVLAYEEGYFESPREADQTTLAAVLGITRQALSSRLRRGYRNLIGSTLVDERHDSG